MGAICEQGGYARHKMGRKAHLQTLLSGLDAQQWQRLRLGEHLQPGISTFAFSLAPTCWLGRGSST